MKAIILAAGMGLRLQPMTKRIPKCLITVNGKTILERIVQNCVTYNITDFIIVIGHARERICKFVPNLRTKYQVNFDLIENPDYKKTNTAVSLELALSKIDEDVLIINGDNVFDKRMLMTLFKYSETAILIDNIKDLNDESFKVKTDGYIIEQMGKNIEKEKANGEFIGISKINKRDLKLFKYVLEELIHVNPKQYYDFAFIPLSINGLVSFAFTNKLKWTEIDTGFDLIFAQKLAKEIDNQQIS